MTERITPDNWIVKYTEHYGEHPIYCPHIKTERPLKETDYPRRHPGKLANQKVDLESREQIDEWWETEKGKSETLYLGS